MSCLWKWRRAAYRGVATGGDMVLVGCMVVGAWHPIVYRPGHWHALRVAISVPTLAQGNFISLTANHVCIVRIMGSLSFSFESQYCLPHNFCQSEPIQYMALTERVSTQIWQCPTVSSSSSTDTDTGRAMCCCVGLPSS